MYVNLDRCFAVRHGAAAPYLTNAAISQVLPELVDTVEAHYLGQGIED